MLKDKVSLLKILENFEGVLQLEPNDKDSVDTTINNSIKALERAYGCSLDKSIYVVQAENSLIAGGLDTFLNNITKCLQELTCYTSIHIVHGEVPFSLADVNYLGFEKAALSNALHHLLRYDLYVAWREKTLPPISSSLSYVSMCAIKRLFCIMLMLDRLGIYEGSSIVVQLLFLGRAS